MQQKVHWPFVAVHVLQLQQSAVFFLEPDMTFRVRWRRYRTEFSHLNNFVALVGRVETSFRVPRLVLIGLHLNEVVCNLLVEVWKNSILK